jgi:epoxyqueuosine reductase
MTSRSFIIQEAKKLGFSGLGFAPIEPYHRGSKALHQWLDLDHHGEMAYMAKHKNRGDPVHVLAEVKSLIVVALPYANQPEPDLVTLGKQGRGFVARYARGQDYHKVFKHKLFQLADTLSQHSERAVLARPCVDTAPLLEREFAHRSGLGFIAKNTMLIMPGLGSYILLGELLVDLSFPPDMEEKPRCGDCVACLSSCPTGALLEPYVLDARRCISYLTIEFRGTIPRHLRDAMGTMVFGCDLCQSCCPFNAKEQSGHAQLTPFARLKAPPLAELLNLSSSGYRRLVKDSALRRASRHQLARNAAVAMGNSDNPSFIPMLKQALTTHTSTLVREHVAWALGKLAGAKAQNDLRSALEQEVDPTVRQEIELVLSQQQ